MGDVIMYISVAVTDMDVSLHSKINETKKVSPSTITPALTCPYTNWRALN